MLAGVRIVGMFPLRGDDVLCGKSVLRCEDQKIRILIFCAGCCGLDTRKNLIDARKAHRSPIHH
jgi:hypothetical protein